MRSYTFAAAFAALAAASPLPQEIDWAAVDALAPIPTVTIPVVDVKALASTISYEPSAAATSIAAEFKASGVTATPSGLKARAAATCKPQPTGSGPKPDTDSAEAFLAYPAYSTTANGASTPAGYYNTFKNLNASNNAYGYMGYTVLTSYDTSLCASKCDKIDGCAAFNLYYERDPSQDPGTGCENPSSTINIKCVFWGGPVSVDNAKNYGQYRNQFHVVIAGSNGYVSNKLSPPSGFSDPMPLGDAAINAPLDCNSKDTYLGDRIFQTGPFDVSKCAAACKAQADYNRAHPATDGSVTKTCQFFNTYMLLKNGDAVGQYCALYAQSWPASYATNRGQYRGSDKYTIAYSFISSNATNPAPACQPSKV